MAMLPKWNMADIRARMFNRPLLVTRDKALDAVGVMGPRLNVGSLFVDRMPDGHLSLADLRARADRAKVAVADLPGDGGLQKRGYDFATDSVVTVDPYEIWRGAAIFSVRGTLMAENGIDPMSGATGYDGLSFKARHAADNPEVLGAILDIDSCGGEVVDLLELCSQFRDFAGKKPLRAIVRGTAASAAYALAACAGPGNITAAPYSIVGSIGAIMLHADFSQQLKDEGVDVTMITSAQHKADASQLKPLEPDVQERLQGMVDDCAGSFIDHVADARSMSRDAIVAEEARFYSGQDALDQGLVDKFMPWDESMREFVSGLNGGSRGAAASASAPGGVSSKGPKMEITQEQHDAAVSAARAEGVTEGTTAGTAAGATAERGRITSLATIAGVDLGESLSAAISDGVEPGAFAVAQAQAGNEKLAAGAAAGKREAVSAEDLPAGSAAGAAGGAGAKVNRGEAAVQRLAGKVPGLPKKG